MIKLQVLRYMGILTVMKLGFCLISAFSLLIGFTWFLIYCPVNILPVSSLKLSGGGFSVQSPVDHIDFDRVEHPRFQERVLNDLKNSEEYHIDNAPEKLHNEIVSSNEGNVIPQNLFTDDVFDSLIKNINQRNVHDFEIMANSTNLIIYRRPKGNAGLYEYKLYAVTPEATPKQITAVFLDNEYRLSWDAYVTDLYTVQKNAKGPDVVYFNIDLPWPLANRDYVYARETRRQSRDKVEYTSIVMHSVLHDTIPHVRGVIRVNDYHQSIVMTHHGPRGSKLYIEYYDDPKGSIPSWLVNWAAKTGVPSFLDDLQRACAGLNKFLQKHNKQMLTLPLYS